MVDQIKAIFIFVALVVVGLAIYQYINVWSDLEGKLVEANRQLEELKTARANLQDEVSELKQKEEGLLNKVALKDQDIAKLNAQIKSLEAQFQNVRTATLGIVDAQEIAREFRHKFDLHEASIKVRSLPIYDPVSGDLLLNRQNQPITEPYLTIPVDYVKEFIVLKDEVDNCSEQKKLHEKITVLEREKTELVGAIAELKEDKAQAYLKAYEEAYSSFSIVHKNYVDLLKAPPKVELNPSWLQLIGGLVGGVVLCKL